MLLYYLAVPCACEALVRNEHRATTNIAAQIKNVEAETYVVITIP